MFSATYNLRTSPGKAESHHTQLGHAEGSHDKSTNGNRTMLEKSSPITHQLEKRGSKGDALDTSRHPRADSINAQHEAANIKYEREVLKRNREVYQLDNRRVKSDTPNTLNHPQTASILAQHEAANIEYEREVLKRNMEIKANKPVSRASSFQSTCQIYIFCQHVFGRGGVGNLSESRSKTSTKPFKRAYFKGGRPGISSLSPPSDLPDDEDHKKYAQIRDRCVLFVPIVGTRLNGRSTSTSPPLSFDTQGKYKAGANGVSMRAMLSRNFTVSESSSSSISPSKEKHAVSSMWKKIVRSNSRSPHPGYDKHQNLLGRAEMVAHACPPSFNDLDHKDGFPGSLDGPPISPVSSAELAFAL